MKITKLTKALTMLLTLTITTTTLAACSTSSAGNANNKHKKHKKHKKHRVEETIRETQAPTDPTSETEPTTPQPTESEINIQQEIHDLYYDPAYKDFDVTPDGKIVINVTSYNDELPNFIDIFLANNPDVADTYVINTTIISAYTDNYEDQLVNALNQYDITSPDIYVADSSYASKFINGDASHYAAPYDTLGLPTDLETALTEAEIAPYVQQVGTRHLTDPDANSANSANPQTIDQIVALSFNAAPGACVYRRSIAMDVFGTDDPATIAKKIGGGTGNFDAFKSAANTISKKGYYAISSNADLWRCYSFSMEEPWVTDHEFNIKLNVPSSFADLMMDLHYSGAIHNTIQWSNEWTSDFTGTPKDKPVFGFFGPSWFINYTVASYGEDTFGDWAICEPPVNYFWGGEWVFCNEQSNPIVKQGAGEILYWLTLDATEQGAQYLIASGALGNGIPLTVPSAKVMRNCDGTLDVLSGQDMYEVFIPALEQIDAKTFNEYSYDLNLAFTNFVVDYLNEEIPTITELMHMLQDYYYNN